MEQNRPERRQSRPKTTQKMAQSSPRGAKVASRKGVRTACILNTKNKIRKKKSHKADHKEAKKRPKVQKHTHESQKKETHERPKRSPKSPEKIPKRDPKVPKTRPRGPNPVGAKIEPCESFT